MSLLLSTGEAMDNTPKPCLTKSGRVRVRQTSETEATPRTPKARRDDASLGSADRTLVGLQSTRPPTRKRPYSWTPLGPNWDDPSLQLTEALWKILGTK